MLAKNNNNKLMIKAETEMKTTGLTLWDRNIHIRMFIWDKFLLFLPW